MHRLDTFPDETLIGQYRTVFSSRSGLDVLAHMLWDLGVFQQITDGAEDVSLQNYGLRLVSILSGGEVDGASIQNFLERIMKQPLSRARDDN